MARVDNEATIDLTTRIPTSSGFNGNTVKNAVTENGSTFFVTAGTAATARQVNLGGNTSTTMTGGGGYNTIQRFGGVSYYINFQVPGYISGSTAIPLTTKVASTLAFNGSGTNVSQSLYLLDADPAVSFNGTGYDLLYTSDITNGIRKWYFDDAAPAGWMYAGVVNPASTPSVSGGFYSIIAKMVGGKPELYAVKGAAANNSVMKIVDESGRTGNWATTPPTATTLTSTTAGANYMLRGIAFAPTNVENLTASVSVDNTIICSGLNAVFNLSGTNGAIVTYNINGAANATTTLTGGLANITVSGATANQTLNLVSMTDGTTTQSLTGSTLITVNTPSVSGTISGGTTPVCTGTNSTVLTLNGRTGTILRWESSTDNFATAGTSINFLSTPYTATNLTTTTSYRAVVQSGTCAVETSPSVTVTVNPLPTITGTFSTLVGGTTTLVGSGTASTVNPWVSATTSVAMVNSSGVVTGVSVGTSVITYTNSAGCSRTATVTVNLVTVAAKVFFEGPFNAATNKMKDDLRSLGVMAAVTTEPYTGLGFTHIGGGGGEIVNSSVFNTTGDNAIVDWIMVELRSASDPNIVLHTRAALIQVDGDIVDLDGVSPVVFTSATAKNYYIGIRHRNHLAIKTNAVIDLSTGNLLDFSDKTTNISSSKMNEINNLKVMRGGEVTGNDRISTSDISLIRISNVIGQINDYKIEDINMNGRVSTTDVSITRSNNKTN